MSSTDIVAYTYRADTYCPNCIISVLPTGPDEMFDGWAIADGADYISTEDNLTEIAAAFQIDRFNESSFDSGDFPKVVFESQVEYAEWCGKCGAEIIEGLDNGIEDF